ncbi:UNVERIFIED_CONTAM: hypothetical protein Scaly_1420600 [Sesamum calycinum]|uniref:Mitochondrial import inner membrane translocase subunit TIM50 n=1 Tax=Sesamum calycinum TaxID=2727403 RepID=A0AAW2PM84_9LAMI
MNQVPSRGECLPEDINEMEEQKKSCDSTESSDTGQDIHEEAEPINCNANISLTQKNDDNAGTGEVLDEDESINTCQMNKRLKKTELSNLPTTDSEIIDEAGSSSSGLPHRIGISSLDQQVELESVEPCCSESISEKRVIVQEGVSVEAVENKLLEDALDCCLDFQKTSSNSDDKCCLTSQMKIQLKIVMLTCLYLHHIHDEAKETVSDVEVRDVVFAEENIGVPRVTSGDALNRVNQPVQGEQCVTSNADLSLKPLDSVKGVASQVVNQTINVTVNRAFAGYTGKKLLVLDVNGLLVDISSYVPYDPDPDDIILKKAVFKRPYCDDFLKFCFERFNVGVWSSRTKRNMEPILEFLLGNDKCKLLFCWDQSHCTDTGFTTIEKRHKPLLLKKLKKLWDKCDPDLPWERGVYNESNTLLLDDTPYKALSNPQYTAVFPYSYRFTDVRDNSLGPGGDLRVYLEGLAMAENVPEYVKQNPFGQRPITEKNLSWGYYLKVIEASSTPPRETGEADS